MKLIFSRKGVDSSAGGMASPLLGERPLPLPLPIPAGPGPSPSLTCYGDLAPPLPALAADLSGRRLGPATACHHDPDIDSASLARPRLPGWRGAFGQSGASQTQLANRGVGPGDLFLFFGFYRKVEQVRGCWRYVPGAPALHAIFGWLQVGEVVQAPSAAARYPWLARHPHALPGWPRGANAIYIASPALDLPGLARSLPGAGMLSCARVLTAPGRSRSVWRAPAWLDPRVGGCGVLRAHDWASQPAGLMSLRGQWQECVCDIARRADARDWLAGLFVDHAR